MTRMLVAVALVVAASACAHNAARDDALAKAQAAKLRGDLVGEALALRDACGFDKENKELCTRADTAWKAAQDDARKKADAACASVDTQAAAVEACFAAVGEVRRMSPTDPHIAELATAAGVQHVKHCVAEAPAAATDISDALELIRCEDARLAQVGTPAYEAHVAKVRESARELIMAMVRRPDIAGRHGASAELLAAAVCLAPTPDLAQQAISVRATFADRARASIDLHTTMNAQLPDLCGVIAQALDGRAVCAASRDGAPQLTVAGDITLSAIEHSAYDTNESKEYVAGIIRTPNPAYQPAVQDEQMAREARDRARTQYDRDQSQCSSAQSALNSVSSCNGSCPEQHEKDRACNLAQTSESDKRSKESSYEDAERRLQNTKPIEEHEDIRTATYTVRHHSWRAPWRAHLRNDGKPIDIGGETKATDVETAGAPVAGVPRDPLTPPGDRWYVGEIRDQVGAQLAKILDESLRRRASDLGASCAGGVAWTGDYLECWARTHFWMASGGKPDGLLKAATDASDAKKGAAWPALTCAR